jgi:hypothetical protein
VTPALPISNAVRLLTNAEMTTDLALMKQLDEMAMSWIRMAEILCEHTEAQSEPRTPGG